MGSASREALERAQATLTSLGGKVTPTVAADLFTAAAVVAGSSTLCSAIADNVVDTKVKTELVKSLFARASAPAKTVLEQVAASRWSANGDVVSALEDLGIRAYGMTTNDGLEQELLEINRVISSVPDLELTLGSKLGDASAKGELLRSLLHGRASQAAVDIASYLVANARGRRVGAMLTEAAEIVADQAGFALAKVTAARALSDAQLTKVQVQLEKTFARKLKLSVEIDPAIVGGLRVQLGDEVIDGSVATQLKELQLQLAS